MKKILSVLVLFFVYAQSFAITLLQEAPPPPNTTYSRSSGSSGPTDPTDTPINFIVPFLMVSAVLLIVAIVRKQQLAKQSNTI